MNSSKTFAKLAIGMGALGLLLAAADYGPQAPLLGSSRGGSAQWDFCHGQPDGALFTGTDATRPEAGFGIATFTADQHNQPWRIWGGFMTRPDHFDALVAERYGSGFGSGRWRIARSTTPMPSARAIAATSSTRC